ncbi:MAG: signal peptidase I [Pirellulaceae bacterium]
MSTVAKSVDAESPASDEDLQSFRETVESIVVAFILAFLFRAFVAEAFVIPTGSMAPTLMGAHKDLVCEWCGRQYQAGASREFEQSNAPRVRRRGLFSGLFTQPNSDYVTVASTCSVCRGVNAYNLRGNANHASFSGDRILVSKFDYILSNPARWDVFVFKYPTEARTNYIKRLVGLPGEELLIRDGDVYTKQRQGEAAWQIARKPPDKIKAMRRIVDDTKYIPPVLVKNGWPSRWQPFDDDSAWIVQQQADVDDETIWSAKLAKSATPQWLRYYHKFVSEDQWQAIRRGEPVPAVEPKSSTLITDYLAYNSSYLTSRANVYDERGKLQQQIQGDHSALEDVLDRKKQFNQEDGPFNDGFHWVGDLISEYDVEITSDSGKLLLDLIEFGIHFQLSIDVATGGAKLAASESGQPLAIFGTANEPVSELTAETSIKGAGKYKLEMANVDDQIVVWIKKGSFSRTQVVKFDQPATFNSYSVRSAVARRPYWTSQDPLDAAPIAIGGQDLEMKVDRARVYRDIYYIAVQSVGGSSPFSDYPWSNSAAIVASVPDAEIRRRVDAVEAVVETYAHPEWWAKSNLFALRGELRFDLEDQQYFPMGDNSSASSDARVWSGNKYVEEKFLLGKALLVFWPHAWNRPIPFTPNFGRMMSPIR